jgi:hypothetical protein
MLKSFRGSVMYIGTGADVTGSFLPDRLERVTDMTRESRPVEGL